jgi:large subunit ribosomal protein L21
VTYAIIKVAGKQYRVREGERLLVDRLPEGDGTTLTPAVLLVGGDGEPTIAPTDVKVTARVLGAAKGPKIRIGKYKKRTGYRRHTGFRASLTQIEIQSIGGAKRSSRAAEPRSEQTEAKAAVPAKAGTRAKTATRADAPEGYAEMTIAQIKAASGSWDLEGLRAALGFEQGHSKRKGAIAALESAIADKEGES